MKFILKEELEDGSAIYGIDATKHEIKLMKNMARKMWRQGKINKNHIREYGFNCDCRNLRNKMAAAIGKGIEKWLK